MEEFRPGTTDLLMVGDTDPLTPAELRAMTGSTSSPRVTIHLPTHRRGADVRQDPVQLRNLLDEAARELTEAGHGDHIEPVLGPVRELLDDKSFWQHQSDGLAVFASPDVHRWYRVALSLTPSVTVGDAFHVAPLVPLLSTGGEFLVLALSQNEVRLFAADRWSIRALDLGDVPTSMAEALAHEDPERQLQARSVGGGEAVFHGHGVGEQDKAAVERFLRAVDHGLQELLGSDPRPLVLACVGYYVPIFRSIARHADVVDEFVEGNPERLKPAELHAAAWACVEPRAAARDAKAWSRYGDAVGSGHVAETPEDAATRANEGRVDTLFVALGSQDETVDRAVLATLGASGDVIGLDAAHFPAGQPCVALLRY